jgi:hypothetical protein
MPFFQKYQKWEKSTVNSRDLAQTEIQKLIFQQKRSMLQTLIDHDKLKGMRVKGPEKVEINF